MSAWTYVIGAVRVDTNSKTAVKDVNKFLVTAPRITSSERNANIFVNKPMGHNWHTGVKDYETHVVITISGHLRDRYKAQTEEELKAFMEALEQRFDIEYKSFEVSGY